MKKIYITPALQFIRLGSVEIIATSGPTLSVSDKSADEGQQWGKRRNGIWDDED